MTFQVSKSQYETAIVAFRGIIFHREQDERYFIRIAVPGYYKQITEFIKYTV